VIWYFHAKETAFAEEIQTLLLPWHESCSLML
jgi:hypothetical protein